jgi:hypothetical protein
VVDFMMHKGKKENHEVRINEKNTKNNDLYFGLSGLGVNTTKKDNRNDLRLKEDMNLKE